MKGKVKTMQKKTRNEIINILKEYYNIQLLYCMSDEELMWAIAFDSEQRYGYMFAMSDKYDEVLK